MGRKGYFQLENVSQGVILHTVKMTPEDTLPAFDELVQYLEKKKVPYGNVADLKKVYDKAIREGSALLCEERITPFSGWADYGLSKDGLVACMTLYPSTRGTNEISANEIEKDLENMKVKYGIKKDVIMDAVRGKVFFSRIDIAEATLAVEGYDAELTYNFNTEIDTAPKVKEDGTVDFHQLDVVNKVTKGDVVAVIKPEYVGEDGTNIFGVPIKPKKVARKTFKYGKNLHVSPNGLELISDVTGMVALEGDKVFVSSEFEILTDVNTGTGDIDFDGDVKVRGNVLAGFKITATGNVLIQGVVEGAEITAGGNIVLSRGIQGMNKGKLVAGGDIIATFIESAEARAGGKVEVDALLHSKISAGTTIECRGKNGYIIGGSVRAGKSVTAKTYGSAMGTNTIVGVGVDPEMVARSNELKAEIMKISKEKEQVGNIVNMLKERQAQGGLNEAKAEALQKSTRSLILLDSRMSELRQEFKVVSETMQSIADARIKVTGVMFAGVKLEISDAILFVRDKNQFCQFIKKDGEVVRVNL